MNIMNLSSGQPFNTRAKKIAFFAALTLLVLGAAFAIYAILITPSKQPYRDAQAQYRNVYNANVALIARGAQLNANSASEQQTADGTKAMKNILTAIKKENELLGEKDVLKSGEGQQLYATFSSKLAAYLAFNDDMLTSRQIVRPVIAECSARMANVTEDDVSVKAMRSCSDAVSAVKDVPNSDYRNLVEQTQALYLAFADNLQKRADLVDPKGEDSAQYDVYTNEQKTILKSLEESSATFAKNLNAHKAEVDITESAKALDDYLTKKSRVLF